MPHKIRDLIPPRAKSPKCYGTKLRTHFDQQIGQRAYGEVRKVITALEERLPNSYPPAATRIGIEIEVENIAVDRATMVPLPWTVKGDGSLRNNGVEFISVPILPQDVSLAMASLYGYFKGSGMRPDFSWRTSTHVHLEANQMSVSEFKNFVLLYLIFEDSLFQFSNPGRRETNIYCTPLSRTNYQILRALLQAEDDETFVRVLSELPRKIFKYSALNLSHIFGYGTVEFRHLGGEKNPSKVCNWLGLLLKLFESSTRLSRQEIERNVRELNTNSFYRHFLSEVFGNLSPFLESDQRDLFLSNGVMVCKEILTEVPPIRKLPPGTKNGLEIFGETEAKKLVSDPLEEKRKSLAVNEELPDVDGGPELEEVQDAPPPPNIVFEVDITGRRHYPRTPEGAAAARDWWNPHGFQALDEYLMWRLQQGDWRGFARERTRWEYNTNPRHQYTPV